jgi:diguanylate cyclase (GGDEF)-like protein
MPRSVDPWILRAADIPCRYGGEEFCVLLPETDGNGARSIAERIRLAIASLRVEEGAGSLGTTVSIGVSCYPDHYEGSVAGLLQKADQALYAAKRAGKDRVMLSAA